MDMRILELHGLIASWACGIQVLHECSQTACCLFGYNDDWALQLWDGVSSGRRFVGSGTVLVNNNGRTQTPKETVAFYAESFTSK